jgi:hypothetical protein
MSEDRFMVTKRDASVLPGDQVGTPIEEAYSGITRPRMLDKPVVFPSRDEQIRKRDAEFHARLERSYEMVKITTLPAPSSGDHRSDIQKPDIAAAEVRVRLMRHFPDGPGMASIAQQAGSRYDKALGKWLENDGARRPGMSALARRWRLFCHDHSNAEQEYYEAGYRPALVNPAAIDFSEVKLTGRERKAALKDRGVGLKRTDDRER